MTRAVVNMVKVEIEYTFWVELLESCGWMICSVCVYACG